MEHDEQAPQQLLMDAPPAVIAWSRPLADWDRPELLALLDEPSLARLRRLHREQDRARMVTARALLAAAGRTAQDLGLIVDGSRARLREPAEGTGGKPSIGIPGWQASVSHDNAVVVVLARAVVGVDTQAMNCAASIRGLAPVFTGHERQWLACHLEEADALRLWTAKEALLKARGTGFRSDPRLPENDTLARPDAQLAHWRPFPDAMAALAVLGAGPLRWPGPLSPFREGS